MRATLGPKKRCPGCRLELPLLSFHRSTKARSGRKPRCKACAKVENGARYQLRRDHINAQGSKWYNENKGRVREMARKRYWQDPKNRDKYLAKNRRRRFGVYGITEAIYLEMHAAQGGKCLICSERFPKLVIDHDHETDEIRGLLCFKCNSGLGLFDDLPDRLRSAAAYIDTFRRQRDGDPTFGTISLQCR